MTIEILKNIIYFITFDRPDLLEKYCKTQDEFIIKQIFELYSSQIGIYINSKEIVKWICSYDNSLIKSYKNFLQFILEPFGLRYTLTHYYQVLVSSSPYSDKFLNWFTYLILLSLWLRRKKLANTDVFNVTQYFIFIVLVNELAIPDVFSRFLQYAAISGTFMIGRLGAANIKFGFMLMMFISFHSYYNMHFNPEFYIPLSQKIYGGYRDLFSGLGDMIFYFDTNFNLNSGNTSDYFL